MGQENAEVIERSFEVLQHLGKTRTLVSCLSEAHHKAHALGCSLLCEKSGGGSDAQATFTCTVSIVVWARANASGYPSKEHLSNQFKRKGFTLANLA